MVNEDMVRGSDVKGFVRGSTWTWQKSLKISTCLAKFVSFRMQFDAIFIDFVK